MVESLEEKRTNREISNANLKVIQPGQVLNPGGRPKGTSLTAVLRELLNQIPKGDNKELKEAVVKALIKKALTGDTRALDIIFDRTDGKVTLPIGGDIEKPFYSIIVQTEEGKKDLERVLKGERT